MPFSKNDMLFRATPLAPCRADWRLFWASISRPPNRTVRQRTGQAGRVAPGGLFPEAGLQRTAEILDIGGTLQHGIVQGSEECRLASEASSGSSMTSLGSMAQ